MSTRSSRKVKKVTLLRPGFEAQEFSLPAGSTLADLLRAAQASAQGQEILIDGRPVEEVLALSQGAVVSLRPRPTPAAGAQSWLDTMGMFHNDPAFEEMMRAVEAEREAEKERL